MDTPTPTRPRALSQASTQYSIDAAALYGSAGDSSALDIPLPGEDEDIDLIRTEDIDGPSDFTQNMGYWMRTKLPVPTVTEPGKLEDETVERDLEEWVESDSSAGEIGQGFENEEPENGYDEGNEERAEEMGEQNLDEEEDEQSEGRVGEEEVTDEEPANMPSTRSTSNGTLMQNLNDSLLAPTGKNGTTATADDDANYFSSSQVLPDRSESAPSSPSATLGNASRPTSAATTARTLQPTVEDYDDTPRKVTPVDQKSVRSDDRRASRQHQTDTNQIEGLQQQLSRQKEQSDARVAELENLLTAARTQNEKLNGSWTKAMQNARAEHEQTLDSQYAASASEVEGLKAEIGQLGNAFEEYEKDAEERLTATEQAHVEALTAARKDHETIVQDLRTQLEHAESKATVASNVQEKILQEIQTQHQQELVRQRDYLTRQTQIASAEIERLKARNAELEEELMTKDAELERLRAAQSSATKAHEAELTTLRESLTDDLHSLKSDLEQANTRLSASKQLLAAQKTHAEELEEQRDDYEQQIRDLRSTSSSLRTQLQAEHREALEEARQQHENEIEERNSAYLGQIKGLKEQVTSLQQQLEEACSENNASHSATHKSYEAELAQLKATSEARIADLEHRLSTAQQQRDEALTQLSAKDQHPTVQPPTPSFPPSTILDPRIATLEASLTSLRQHLDSARLDLSRARDDRRDAEQEAANARQQTKALRTEADAQAAALWAKEDELHDLRDKLADQRSEAWVRVEALQVQMEGLREGHEAKIEEMRGKAEEAVKRIGGLLEGERKAAEEARKEAMRLSAALEQSAERVGELEDEREALRNDTQLQRADVEAAEAEARAAREEAEMLRGDYESVNREMDERIVELIRTKEKEWAARFEKLWKERKMMGKALMHEWGKEECGVKDPQAYRYKYVEKA